MSIEDTVLVIGEEKPDRQEEPRRSSRRGVAPFVLLATVLVSAAAAFLAGGDDPGGDVDSAELAAPVEPPPTPPPEPEPVPADEPWTELEIPGPGIVTNVVRGDPGWLAVVLDDTTRVLSSADGRRWTETALDAPAIGAFLPAAVSGSGMLAVAGGVSGDSEPFTSWVSDDAGINWTQVPFPDDAVRLHSLSQAPVGLYATGERRVAGGTEAVVWWLVGGPRWEPLPVRSDGGSVVDLVSAAGVAAAIGYEDGPELWTIRGREFVPVRISVPEEAAGSRPLEAVVDDAGRVVMLLRRGSTGPLQVLRSSNLLDWEMVGEAAYRSVTALGRHRGDAVILLGGPSYPVGPRALLIGEEGLTELELPGGDGVVLGIDSHGDLSVAGGVELDGATRLWSNRAGGSHSEGPTVVGAGGELRWTELATGPRRTVGYAPGDNRRPRAVAAGHAVMVTAGGDGAFEVASGVGDWRLVERAPARAVLAAGTETWLTQGDSLLAVTDDGSLELVESPPAGLAAAARIGGATVFATFSGEMYELAEGGWAMRGRPELPESSGPVDVRGTPGAFLARHPAEPATTLAWSGDGSWEPVDGTLGSSPSGSQFLVTESGADRSVVELVDEWPETTRLEIPARYPLEVVQVDGEIRVRTPDQVLFTGDGGASWDSHPLEGVRGAVVLLPTREPAIAVMDSRRTRIMMAGP